MLKLVVGAQVMMGALVRRVKEEQAGLTAIEYGIFAAFLVMMLLGAALIMGPQLKSWLLGTTSCIMSGGSGSSCRI